MPNSARTKAETRFNYYIQLWMKALDGLGSSLNGVWV